MDCYAYAVNQEFVHPYKSIVCFYEDGSFERQVQFKGGANGKELG